MRNFFRTAALLLIAAPLAGAGETAPPVELRGVWITAADAKLYASRESIAEGMDALARHNVNAVYPSVWTRGSTLWPSAACESATGERIDPRYAGRDPLAELVLEAHRRGIEVHPWFEFGFAAGYKSGGGALLRKHREWAALDREGRLVETDGYEWLDALDPEVQAFLTALVLEVARGYEVDGIQLGARLPALPASAGYGERMIERWKRERGGDDPASDDPAWYAWRAGILTAYLEKLASAVRGAGPGLVLALSPVPYPTCNDELLQDLSTWTGAGLVSAIQPQCHAREADTARAQIDVQAETMPRTGVIAFAPSILAGAAGWRIDDDDLLELVAHGRTRACAGQILFHYDALRAEGGALLTALSEGPYEQRALVPQRKGAWRPPGIENGFDGETSLGTWELIEGREDAFRETSGEPAELSYLLDVPVAAAYEAWLEIPRTAGLPPKITRVFHIGQRKPDSAQVAVAPGMLALGRIQVTAPGRLTLKIAVPPHASRRMAVGPALLLLDRRRSPDVVWSAGP